MVADGVSLPTNIAQMGQVAKSQARGQQQVQPTTPFSQQQDQQEELRVRKVKETDAADHRRIEPDDDERGDKRRQRRHRRRRKLRDRAERERARADDGDETDGKPDEDTVGGLIDLRA